MKGGETQKTLRIYEREKQEGNTKMFPDGLNRQLGERRKETLT